MGSGRLRRAPLDRCPPVSVGPSIRVGEPVHARSLRLQPGVGLPGVEDGLPAGAATEMGREGAGRDVPVVVVSALGVQTGEAADDPRRAEPALAAPGGRERCRPAVPNIGIETLQGCDPAVPNPTSRGDAGDPGLPIDEHGAAPALTLRAAPVLHRAHPELLAQHVQQRQPLVGDNDRRTVHDDLEAPIRHSSHGTAG